MKITESKKNSPWFLLWFPPILFLLIIVVFSIYFGVQAKGDANAIAMNTATATPYILLTVQVILLITQFAVFRRQGLTLSNIGWQVRAGQEAWKELVLGAVIGAPIAVLWVYIVGPAMTNLQKIWDYVPAGSLFTALGGVIIPFAIADVLLAPFVEENIYRGYGMTKLMERFGATGTILLSSLFFGLLHWAGGFWYILTVGILVGIPFAILRYKRGNIYVTFGAHVALNLVETLLLWLVVK